MKEDQRFRKLLSRHMNNEITDEEKAELHILLKSGIFDHVLKEEISYDLQDEVNSYDTAGEIEPVLDTLYLEIRQILPPDKLRISPLTEWFQRYGSVAATLIVISGLFALHFLWKNEPLHLSRPIPLTEEWVQLDKKGAYTLPDGSSVNLKGHSQLSYLKTFNGESREVKLSGEADFDVSHDPGRPFIVHTGDIHTKVLGTAFNITTSDKAISVTVMRGLVEVSNNRQVLEQVKAAEQLTVNPDNHEFKKISVHTPQQKTSNENVLYFNGTSLEEVATRLENQFDVVISFENRAIKQCRVKASFTPDEKLDNILELVFGTRQATYATHGNRILIKGGIGCDTN